MAKNITILEGSTSKSFSGVNKLRVNNVGGGTSDWVPEDETQLTTKHISENGTYTASDDGYYGYSEVTVSGVGSVSYTAQDGDVIGGVELTEGNEYDISTDPETGDVVVEELPSYIVIGHQPDKTSYLDGETIDTDGLVIKAYTADGELWENENYFQGTIPLSEITIVPTTADLEQVDSGTYDQDGVYIKVLTMSAFDATGLKYNYAQGYPYNPELTDRRGGYDVFGIGAQVGSSYFVTVYNGRYYAKPVSGSWTTNQGVYWIEPDGYTATSGFFFYGDGWTCNGEASNSSLESTSDAFLNLSTSDIERNMTRGQTIAVKWNRYGDSVELQTSFNITVRTESSGETSGETSEESGTGGGHSF